MDLTEMNKRLRDLHAQTMTLSIYQDTARRAGNDVLFHAYAQDIRELQEQAKALQDEIDQFLYGGIRL